MEKYYPLGDYYPGVKQQHSLRGTYSGEYRFPKKGEWYLSGAIPAAYRAPNDLHMKFPIARIVRVEVITTLREVAL